VLSVQRHDWLEALKGQLMLAPNVGSDANLEVQAACSVAQKQLDCDANLLI
jgi:hypothetical protein